MSRIQFGLILLLIATPVWAAEKIAVDIKPPVIETRTFDPKHPPSEMPRLEKNEAAVTVSDFVSETVASVTVLSKSPTAGGCQAEVRIESITVRPALTITKWLPKNVTRKVATHEQGHQKISEIYYDKVEPAARDLASTV